MTGSGLASRPLIMGLTVAALAVALTGCTERADPPAASSPPSTTTTTGTSDVATMDVVTPQGVGLIRFGADRAELESEHGLVEGPGDCGPRLPAYPMISPVLDGGRLVLLWADPPLRTPDGLGVGSPVAEVRQTHPDAEELAAPPDSYRFDGLLVPVDGHAYLFLHDQERVQKLIVGSERHARLVFEENFGTC